MYMKIMKFFEIKKSDFEPIKSFKMKDNLCPDVWDGFKIKEDILEQLLTIGKDFFENIDIDAKLIDMTLVGSLANYNWSSKYSDFDLHIIINFEELGGDIKFIIKFCDYAKKIWNREHDITINGFPVEIGLQDEQNLIESMESKKMGGVFSLTNNKWIKKPEKVNFEMDSDLIIDKSKTIMMMIDDVEVELNKGGDYYKMDNELSKAWKKIKDSRKSGLELEGGEFSVGNLVFKLLRRNGYIEKVIKLRKKLYESKFK